MVHMATCATEFSPRNAPQNSNIYRVTTVTHGICTTEVQKGAPQLEFFLVVRSRWSQASNLDCFATTFVFGPTEARRQ